MISVLTKLNAILIFAIVKQLIISGYRTETGVQIDEVHRFKVHGRYGSLTLAQEQAV